MQMLVFGFAIISQLCPKNQLCVQILFIIDGIFLVINFPPFQPFATLNKTELILKLVPLVPRTQPEQEDFCLISQNMMTFWAN